MTAPTCMLCSRPLRTPEELAVNLADARELLAHFLMQAARSRLPRAAAVEIAADAFAPLARHLAAEFAGTHACCSRPVTVADLEDLLSLVPMTSPRKPFFYYPAAAVGQASAAA